MTDTAGLPTYEDETPDGPVKQPSTPKGMRATIEAQNARIAELEAQVTVGAGQLRAETMSHAYAELKLDPNQGVGRAVATLYDGDADGLADFVREEFGYSPQPDPHPYAAQVALGYHQLDQVGNVAGSIRQASQAERLATAQASGDRDTEGAILAAQAQAAMDRMHGRSG